MFVEVNERALSLATANRYHFISKGCDPPESWSSIDPNSSELQPGCVIVGSPTEKGLIDVDPSSRVICSLITHPAASVTVTV